MAELFQWGKFDSSKVPPQLNYISKFPVGTKIKTSDGTKWEILEFDHEGYPSNTVTLWSEIILQNSTFSANDSIDYRESNIKTLCNTLYNSFSQIEKNCIPLTNLPTSISNTGEVVNIPDYVFVLSEDELGLAQNTTVTDGVKFSKFTLTSGSDPNRVKQNASGTNSTYWTRSAYVNSASSRVMRVTTDGGWSNPLPSTSYGFLPAFNLSKQTILSDEPDSEGYYSIVGLSDNGVVASSLNIGEKVILGKYNNENIPWEIVAKNHYNNNDINLWTPYSIDTTEFNENSGTAESIDYRNSIPKTLCGNIYNSFSEKEKSAVLLTNLPTKVTREGSVVDIQDYIFLYSGTELGASDNYADDTGCTSFNFTNEQKNARCKDVNGSWVGGSTRYGYLWSRTACTSSSTFYVVYWDSNGSFGSVITNFLSGFAPATNISSNTILYKHSDGNYYLDKENGGGSSS